MERQSFGKFNSERENWSVKTWGLKKITNKKQKTNKQFTMYSGVMIKDSARAAA